MTGKQFKVIETITHDDRRIYELTKNDIGYYNFKGEKLLAHMICNELNGLIEKNKVLYKEIERLKRQNEDILYNNAKNMELLEKEKEQLKSKNKILLEHCDDLQERNDRQADTIRELYNLIENKNWKGLTEHIEELNKAEEQLLREWGWYDD